MSLSRPADLRDYPVKLGSILFTNVEPHRGHEVAYNRWYERDHFYGGCLVGPGILAGRRWVCTRDLKKLRLPPDAPIGSYLALYWVSKQHSIEWGTWSGAEVHKLHEAGRMFAERDHVHTRLYRYRGGDLRDPDGVPPELALDHPFKGLAVVTGQCDDRAALAGRPLPHPSVAMRLHFAPIPIPDSAPADVPRLADTATRFLQLSFLDSEPSGAWDPIAAEVDALRAVATVELAAPFIPTIPGTDTYTDELW